MVILPFHVYSYTHRKHYSHIDIAQCMGSLQNMVHNILLYYHLQVAEVLRIEHAMIFF